MSSRIVVALIGGGTQVPAAAILDSSGIAIKDSAGAYVTGS